MQEDMAETMDASVTCSLSKDSGPTQRDLAQSVDSGMCFLEMEARYEAKGEGFSTLLDRLDIAVDCGQLLAAKKEPMKKLDVVRLDVGAKDDLEGDQEANQTPNNPGLDTGSEVDLAGAKEAGQISNKPRLDTGLEVDLEGDKQSATAIDSGIASTNEDEDLGNLASLNIDFDYVFRSATESVPGNHGQCTRITPFRGGGFNEIGILHFEDGYTCLARFRKNEEPVSWVHSELATMRHIRENTTIPIPQVFAAGKAGPHFMIMDRLPGERLDHVWRDLSLEHKKSVLTQLAGVVIELFKRQFDRIGCFKHDEAGTPTNTIGPYVERNFDEDNEGIGPFKTWEDYFRGLIDSKDFSSCCESCEKHIAFFRKILPRHFARSPAVQMMKDVPFFLVHGDFNSRNMIFSHDKTGEKPPQLTGIIDWDSTASLPPYYLLEYPALIREKEYPDFVDYKSKRSGTPSERKLLRQHFVQALISHYPEINHLGREFVRECFRRKEYFLTSFPHLFLFPHWDHGEQNKALKGFLESLAAGLGAPPGTRDPYGGNGHWEADTDEGLEELVEGQVEGSPKRNSGPGQGVSLQTAEVECGAGDENAVESDEKELGQRNGILSLAEDSPEQGFW